MANFELQVLEYINNAIRQSNARALILGGRPGGYVGQLPQVRVQYDSAELATDYTPASGYSLIDNLNHIRYRIQVLESGTYPSGIGFSGAFTDLTDTPGTYTGSAGKILIVNQTETGIEFTDYVPSSGTVGSDINCDVLFEIDGTIASGTNMSYSYIVPRDMAISGVFAYLDDTGTSGDTLVDINKNGTTIFTTQANRPSIAFDSVTKWSKAVPDVVSFVEGDIITLDLDSIASGAEDLTVILAGVSTGSQVIISGAGASTFLQLTDTPSSYTGKSGQMLIVSVGEDALEFSETPSLTVKELDGVPTVSNISTIVFSGAIINDDGGGQVTVTISGGTSSGTYIQHSQAVLTVAGVINTTGVKPLRIYTPDVGAGATIEEVLVALNTSPASTAVRVRVLKNASTILSGTDYIEIGVGSNTASRTTNFTSTSFSKDDYFTLEIVQGDATASDLSVHIRYKWTLDGD